MRSSSATEGSDVSNRVVNQLLASMDGVESMEEYSWLLVYPGITFTITLFALNFFGDGLRDALDPKTTDD